MKNILRTIACCLLAVAFSACSALPPEYFTKDKEFTVYGFYSVSPQAGLSGVGYLDYRNGKPTPDSREIEQRIETLESAVKFMLQKLIEEKKGGAF